MASEQGDQASLPGGIEEWLADQTAETDTDRAELLAQAVESYRLLTEATGDDSLDSRLAALEARLDELETATGDDRIDELEAELDGHVEDLRSRIVEVVKEARSRAPANHSHEPLEGRLDELESDIVGVSDRLAETESRTTDLEAETTQLDEELDSVDETLSRLESKADKLAGAVVKQRRRIERIERHVSHETALATLLETAAREGIEKARCNNCGGEVVLSMLVEPACPHCRSVFEDVEPGTLFFKSASLLVADRPALEAGETTDRPFAADGNQSPSTGSDSQ